MNLPITSETGTASQPELQTDFMVQLEGVSVRYRAPQERLGTFKEYAIRRLRRQVRFADFLALSDINLEIRRGEVLGIVGRNGAGKSTLLKVVSRVLIPTLGRVRLAGRVAPLLELGAGFHPELTGRENVFLNGTLLGHAARDVEAHLGSILEFSELGRFIDAPLRTYSSGMVARLGFAAATAWQPEILLVDEVLAVGDEAFRRKCQVRLEDFRSRGTTTLIVTHDMNTVLTLCNQAVWLERGKTMAIGPATQVVSEYRAGQSRGVV